MNKKYKQRFFILLQRILKSYLERDEQKRRKKNIFSCFCSGEDFLLYGWGFVCLKYFEVEKYAF